MNKLATLIANGEISAEELASAKDLIERAELVKKGIEACKETLKFPIGINIINCYSYTDRFGEYESWGTCTSNGTFKCSCNWGGEHVIGHCNILDFSDVFMAFEKEEFAHDLRRFLIQQIEKVKTK